MNFLRARSGIVLPTVIGVLVLIELLAVATLAVAWQELAVARARAASAQAQLASRSAAARVAAGRHGEIQSLPPGQRRMLWTDSNQWLVQQAELERLTPALFLLRTAAAWGPAPFPAQASAGQLLLGFDPLNALTTLPAALNTSGTVDLLSATLDGLGSNQEPVGVLPATCIGFPVLPDSASALALPEARLLRADITSRLIGTPPVLIQTIPDAASLQQLGGSTFEALASQADRLEAGALELNAVAVAGSCQADAAANWGAPLDPAHPCKDYLPFIHAPGSLELLAGAGQGTLLVEGNLILRPGTRFYGLLLVRGHLLMESGAYLEGAALAQSATLLGAAVQRSHCALARAFRGAYAWNQLRVRPRRAWIPIF